MGGIVTPSISDLRDNGLVAESRLRDYGHAVFEGQDFGLVRDSIHDGDVVSVKGTFFFGCVLFGFPFFQGFGQRLDGLRSGDIVRESFPAGT